MFSSGVKSCARCSPAKQLRSGIRGFKISVGNTELLVLLKLGCNIKSVDSTEIVTAGFVMKTLASCLS